MKIILDACNNHMGNSLFITHMIDLANIYGIDYIKFQLYDHNKLNIWYDDYANYKKMLENCEITEKVFIDILEYCDYLDIKPMFTIFDLDRLKWFLDCEDYDFALKIASPNAMDEDFVGKVAKCAEIVDCPLIISHGMSNEKEIQKIRLMTASNNAFHLYCISKYPTLKKDVDWEYMKKFDGFSDHSKSEDMEIASLIGNKYKGVDVDWYERHFTLSTNLPGKDHRMSIVPEKLEELNIELKYKDNIEKYKKRYKEEDYE